jgi:hypothetical protein
MPETTTHKELSTTALLQVFGGAKGLLDSSVPTGVFMLAYFFGAKLNVAIIGAVATGLVIVTVRRVRGESLQQAFSGFFGLLIAVLIARATGSGRGIFWPGIVITGATGVGFVVSLLVKRPAVALGLVAIDARYKVWPTHEALRRAVTVSTAAWAAGFLIRAVTGTIVMLTVGGHGDRADTVIVAVIVNLVKWPLIIGPALLTVAMVRRAQVPPLADADNEAVAVES